MSKKAVAAAEIKTEVVAIADLKPHPKNYRAHPPDQLAHIAQSIREHGVYRNIVIARDGTVLAGHGVLEALKQLESTHATVVRLDIGPDDPRAIKVLTGDNEIGRLAEIDDRVLSELLSGLKALESPDALLGTGFDDMMLANLVFVTRPESEIEDFDAAAQWVGLPEYQKTAKPFKVLVSFDDDAMRQKFLDFIGCEARHTQGNIISAWWPNKARQRKVEKKFDEAAADGKPAPQEAAAKES